jgi:hypothetical protein
VTLLRARAGRHAECCNHCNRFKGCSNVFLSPLSPNMARWLIVSTSSASDMMIDLKERKKERNKKRNEKEKNKIFEYY